MAFLRISKAALVSHEVQAKLYVQTILSFIAFLCIIVAQGFILYFFDTSFAIGLAIVSQWVPVHSCFGEHRKFMKDSPALANKLKLVDMFGVATAVLTWLLILFNYPDGVRYMSYYERFPTFYAFALIFMAAHSLFYVFRLRILKKGFDAVPPPVGSDGTGRDAGVAQEHTYQAPSAPAAALAPEETLIGLSFPPPANTNPYDIAPPLQTNGI